MGLPTSLGRAGEASTTGMISKVVFLVKVAKNTLSLLVPIFLVYIFI